MGRVVIIGGGITGLVCAYTLSSRSDAEIVLLEKAEELGGLAGSFDTGDGTRLEKYYHFICKMDKTYLRMIKELGIDHLMRWRTTEMGICYNGSRYTFGDPVSLLRFKHLGPVDKIRFALASLRVKSASYDGWRKIEDRAAREWLIDQYGKRTYDLLYKYLLNLKFREYADRISAAWMWARHYRLATSRTWTQKERIGYLDGGSHAYVGRLENELLRKGVLIRVGAKVDGLLVEDNRVKGVRVGADTLACDHLVLTIPLPSLRPLVENLEGTYWDNIRRLQSIGIVALLLRIRQRFSEYFWTNISDPRVQLAGVIEYTNLNPCPRLGGHSLVYLPHYVTDTHPMFAAKDEDILKENCRYLQIVNPDFDPSWVEQHWVYRDRFAQPICEVGFSNRLPAMQTPIENMYLTDSHQLHPHDRSISASTDLGEEVADLVLRKTNTPTVG